MDQDLALIQRFNKHRALTDLAVQRLLVDPHGQENVSWPPASAVADKRPLCMQGLRLDEPPFEIMLAKELA